MHRYTVQWTLERLIPGYPLPTRGDQLAATDGRSVVVCRGCEYSGSIGECNIGGAVGDVDGDVAIGE